MTGLMRSVLGVAAACLLFSGACERRPSEPNSVALFLQGADFQAESAEQKKEVLRALDDALQKTPTELRQSRYADFDGRPGARDIVQLLSGHFVPPRPAALDPATFYDQVGAREARDAIAAQREKLRSGSAPK